MPGSTAYEMPMSRAKAAPATTDAFQLPSLGASRRPRISAPAASSALRAIISRYRAVRRAAVSGSPTAGGLAGYLKNGTSVTVTYRPR